MYTYTNCPKCDGEVAFDIEETDDGSDDIYGSRSCYVAHVNDKESAHANDCTLTDDDRERLANEKTISLGEEGYYYYGD